MSEPRSLSEKIDAGVKAAVAQAIERHRRLGQSISIWRDGKIVTLTADEIPPMQVETPVIASRSGVFTTPVPETEF